jgi:cytochrome P450
MAYRITTRDTELAGEAIAEGTVVAFGLGTHLCLGAELARSEGRAALRQLLDRTSSITRGSHRPVHPPNLTVRAVRSLPVVLHLPTANRVS